MAQEEKIMTVTTIFDQKNATYTPDDVLLLIAIVDKWNGRGYEIGIAETAHFLFNKRNIELIIRNGMTKTIKAMSLMKLGMIKRGKTTGRNEKCPCGSGSKFKKCCINKKS